MESILVYGFRHQAEQLCFYIENEGCGTVAAFVADKEYQTLKELCGRPVICFEDALDLYPPGEYKIAISFAYQHMIHDRAKKSFKCRQAGYRLFTFVSKFASVFAKHVGEGVIIYPGCKISYGVELGDGNFLETGVTIAHHSKIGSWNFFAPSATVCGDVVIGEHNFFGANSTVINGGRVGREVIVGAGAVVRETEDGCVYFPERVVKWHGKSSQIKI